MSKTNGTSHPRVQPTAPEQQMQPQQPQLTPEQKAQQAFIQSLMRQREQALNACASAEMNNAMLFEENTELKKRIEQLEADQLGAKTPGEAEHVTKPETAAS